MKLVKNFIIYSGANVLQKAIGFFLLPLYTRFLTTSDYGIVNIVASITGLLTVLYTLSLDSAATRFQYKYLSDEQRMKETWGTLLIFVLANSLVLTFILFLFHGWLIAPFTKGVAFYPYIMIGLITVSLTPMYNFFQSSLQAKQSGMLYGANNFAFFILNAALTLFFVIVMDLKATGVLLAIAISTGIFFVYSLARFVPSITLKFNRAYFKEAWAYSWPVIPHVISGWAMSLMDRVFINFYKDASTVGLYSIGYQFANLLNIVTSSVNQAYVPWFFEKLREGEEGKAKIVKVAEVVSIAYALAALMVCFGAQEVMGFMVGDAFREGWKVIPILSFAFVFNGLYYFFVNVLFIAHTKIVPIVTFTSAGLNILMNMLLIPRYGMVGAAIASMGTFIASSGLAFALGSRVEKIGFRWLRMYGAVLGMAGISSFIYLRPHFSFAQFSLLKSGILLVILCALFAIYRKDLKQVQGMFFRTRI